MKKRVLYSTIGTVVIAIATSAITGWGLKFEELFASYSIETLILMLVCILITGLACYEFFLKKTKKQRADISDMEKSIQAYKDKILRLNECDEEIKRLRAIVEYRKQNGS